MRYVVVGAGAIGGTIGACLHEHGHEVLLVARGAHYQALSTRGLRFATPTGTRQLAVPVAALSRIELRAEDVLVLAVKTQDSAAVLDALAGLEVAGAPAGGRLPVVCAQNGVENERLALRRFRRVYGMCVMAPSAHLEPGTVVAYGTPVPGMLDLGRYPSGTDELAGRIAADTAASGFDTAVQPEIMRWKYAKLLMNLGNALDAACGPDADWGGLWNRALAEATGCLRAAGITPADDAEWAHRHGDRLRAGEVEGQARGGGSTWQSLARGTGSSEVDYLNGEIVLLGRRYGIATPVNEALQQVAGTLARQRRPPGGLSLADLLRAVESGAG